MFLLFLDCVWQILHQFPCSFEFNEHFLVTLFEHAYASQFGTFLGNNENERLVRLLALNPLNIRLCLVKMLLDLEKVRVMVCSFWTQVSFSCCCCTVCCSARGLLLLSGTWAGQHSAHLNAAQLLMLCCTSGAALGIHWAALLEFRRVGAPQDSWQLPVVSFPVFILNLSVFRPPESSKTMSEDLWRNRGKK